MGTLMKALRNRYLAQEPKTMQMIVCVMWFQNYDQHHIIPAGDSAQLPHFPH